MHIFMERCSTWYVSLLYSYDIEMYIPMERCSTWYVSLRELKEIKQYHSTINDWFRDNGGKPKFEEEAPNNGRLN